MLLITIFSLILLLVTVNCELVAVTLISRHGNRAPNPSMHYLCPNDEKNIRYYADEGVRQASLTGKGMETMRQMGVFTRQQYIDTKFLSSVFSAEDVFIRSSYADRTIASANAFAQGLYPPHSGSLPRGYDSALPNPVAIFTTEVTEDPLLEVRKGYCKATLEHDQNIWDEEVATQIILDHHDLVDTISDRCGTNLTEYGRKYGAVQLTYAVKDIGDSLIFDRDEGFQILVDEDTFTQLKQLQFTLIYNQLLSTPRSPTYIAGSLPQTILQNFHDRLNGKTTVKLWAYHGHREMLYSLGAFIGMPFDVRDTGSPLGALPSSSTIFIELHKEQESVFVRSFIWVPCDGSAKSKANKAHSAVSSADCPYRPVKLKYPCWLSFANTVDSDCEMDCPLAKFEQIIAAPTAKYGSWDQICKYTTPAQLKSAVSLLKEEKSHLRTSLNIFIGLGVFAYVLAAVLGACYINTLCNKPRYEPIGVNEDGSIN